MLRLLTLFIIYHFSLSEFGQIIIKSEFKMATLNIRVPMKKDGKDQWSYRKEKIIDFIRKQRLEIICLQEVTDVQMNYITKQLPEYECVCGSENIIKGEELLPIVYKRNCFALLGTGTFWLSETPDKSGSRGWDGKHTRRTTWTKLKDLKSKRTFLVVNTHLDHVGKEARLEGMKLIKKRIKEISSGNPIILCGDMNCSATSRPYFVALNYDFLMYDAYQIAKSRVGVNYTFHGFGKRLPIESRQINDFIFVTNHFDIEKIVIPKEERRNGVFLSDHCPVEATLVFR